MNNTVKKAIKIANKLKKEAQLVAYNQKQYTYGYQYFYANAFGADWSLKIKLFSKDLYGNKEINKGKNSEIYISDQVVDHFKNKYNLLVKEFDSFTSPKYIKTFEVAGMMSTLEKKAQEFVDKYELWEKEQFFIDLSFKLSVKEVTKKVKI